MTIDFEHLLNLQVSDYTAAYFRRLLWHIPVALHACCLTVARVSNTAMPAMLPGVANNGVGVTHSGRSHLSRPSVGYLKAGNY